MKDYNKSLYYFVAVALVVSVVGITVGFAAMSSELNISGTTEVVPSTWKVKFNNLAVSSISGDTEIVKAPVIQSDTHIGNYSVKLTKPGDEVVYTFDIVNEGNIDAKLLSYTFNQPVITGTGETAESDSQIMKNNLVYTLTYSDGNSINIDDKINKGNTVSLKLTVGYNMAATTLPVNPVSIDDMDITFVYGQQ